MRILVIGSGGREHALLKGLAAAPTAPELHVAPGAPAFANLADVHMNITDIDDPELVTALAKQIEADLVVIGPEVPLVAGVADALREAGFNVFGPNQAAAQLEGSKQFAKEVMQAAGVRTADSEQVLPGADDAAIDRALDNFGPMYVVKDDGLAGGKGVVVTDDREAARQHIVDVHAAGNPVLLESFLDGPEVSLFCLVDGETVVPLLPAQDHKRAFDGDRGPNTGGMGAYTPLPWLPADAVQRIVDEVCVPVAREMVRRGTPYSGLLYAGLAWGKEGPAVVEFNARFGDPETQPVLSLLKTPLVNVLSAVAEGRLAELPPLEWEDGYAVTVVLAAEGYPASPAKGAPIFGSANADLDDTTQVLHAGTAMFEPGLEAKYYANGGRVLNVLGKGATLEEARAAAYKVMDGITMPGGFHRSDIGLAAVEGRITV